MRILFIAILLLLLGTASFFLFSEPTDTPNNDVNVVRIATEGAYPPFNYIDASGNLQGFDVDLSKALCKQAKLNCTYRSVEWDGIIPGLIAGKFDLIAASMGITEERAKVVQFSKPYYRTPIRFIAARGKTLVITPEGLEGKTLGAQRATTSAQFLKEEFGDKVTVKLYDTQENVYLDLLAGRLDAVVADAIPLWEWLQSDSGKAYEFRGQTFYVDEGIAFAARQKDAELMRKVNEALDILISDGTYQKIADKHFSYRIY